MKFHIGDTVLVVEDKHYNYSQLGNEGTVAGFMLGCCDVKFDQSAASYRPSQLKLLNRAVTLTQPDMCDMPLCLVCGQPFSGRNGAKTCSPAHRKALSRKLKE